MQLLERETQLAQLTEGYDGALHGQGCLALVHGEAGAGSTSVVQHFLGALASGTTRLVAGCEPLFTARPLGPLVDLADSLPSALTAALRKPEQSHTLFSDFLAFLRQPPNPKVLLIDDLHWADAGTLDLVRYVGRRLVDTPAMLVVTYRDDDLAFDHPLRRLLGDLPTATTMRVAVPCLSRAGVSMLAHHAQRAEGDLFEITAGNPFFVTELLNCPEAAVPPSVYDATLNRLMCLGHQARAFTELVAISPRRIERTIVAELFDDAATLLDECVERGLLRAGEDWIAFRHELVRQAVELSLNPGRSAELHRRLFSVLKSSDCTDELPRLVHHAQAAGLHDEILDLAPRAAQAASRASAHREAAKHYDLVIRHANRIEPEAQAGLLELAAKEYRLVSDVDATVVATRRALALRRTLDDPLRQGMNLRRLAVALREQGERIEAESTIDRAVDALEQIAPSTELVRAYAEQSRMRAWSDYTAAARIGARAVELANTFDDARCLVKALHASMSARLYLGDDRQARAELERALEIASAENMEDAAAQLFVALQLAAVIHRDHDYAVTIANRGLAYCEARDLDGFVHRLLDNRALSLIELGFWPQADADIARCLDAYNLPQRLRNSLRFLQARQAARRGEADSDAYWLALQQDMNAVPLGYRLPAVAAACAEAAWLRGDATAARAAIQTGIEQAATSRDQRLLGPLLVWARRCGVRVRHRAFEIAAVHTCELAGDVAAAAAHWQAHGCVYERALALLHGDSHQLNEALEQLDTLGAKPAADIVRQRLRALGVRGIRRGPQSRTQADPLGLTRRERQVCDLLEKGHRNAAIAARLHRSERTIESHVAAVLSKLHVSSRVELLTRKLQSTA